MLCMVFDLSPGYRGLTSEKGLLAKYDILWVPI